MTDHPAADQNPSFSPDGRRIVFSSERTGAGDIYVMDLDGGNLEQLTSHESYEGAPRFTRDGERILFEGERDGRAQIYVLDLETRVVERVTPGRSRKLGPVESPDGTRLAYMEKGLIWWQVTVMTWADREEEIVTRGGGSCRPAFAPDGSVLAYVSTRDTAKADVWFRQMTGSREGRAWKVPVRADAHNYDPSISADGRVLATASTFDRGPSEQWDLYLSDLNGRNLVRLTGEEGNERFPDWRPVSSATASR